MNCIAEAAYERLARGETVVLAKITSQQGSTPRAAGTQMVITVDEAHVGTIGGGLLEAKVIALGRELLAGGTARFERFDLGHAEVASMDMICGGGLEVLLDPLRPTKELIALFNRWRQMEADAEQGAFVIALKRVDGQVTLIHHGLLRADGAWQGCLSLTAGSLQAMARTARAAKTMTIMELEDYEVILEPIHHPRTAYILGAGHVAQPTAHMAALVGFRVVVLDDRAEFANPRLFPEAHTVRVLKNFEHPFGGFQVDRSSFIVIVTRGHLYDKVVLSHALGTDAGYIGMIGSRRKRDAIFHRLKKEGFDDKDLQRVHSPIGLNIGAETPEELAVSIVAEMIATSRSGKMKVER